MKSMIQLSTLALLGVAVAAPAMAVTQNSSFSSGTQRILGGVDVSGGVVATGLDFQGGAMFTDFNGGNMTSMSGFTADAVSYDGSLFAYVQEAIGQGDGTLGVYNANGTLNYEASFASPDSLISSVVVAGNYTVVGGSNGAYIYNNMTQSQTHYFTGDVTSVATDGIHLVLGQGNDDTMGFNSGRVDIYDMANLSGGPTGSIFGANYADSLGLSVDVDNSVVVAGSMWADTNGVVNSGGVSLYDTMGNFMTDLSYANPTEDDRFGTSVAIDNGMVVVGAPRIGSSAPYQADGAGAAFVYNTSGDLLETLDVIGGTWQGQNFGNHVAIDGNNVVVADDAFNYATSMPVIDSVYIYELLMDRCDFTGDGLCDVSDLDLMQSLGPIAPGVPAAGNEEFDLDGNGTIDLIDRDQWLADAAVENSLGSPYKLGDANLDGFVDGTDFIAWNASKFTQSLLWSNGDFTADGFVDGTDFIEWNGNKFTSSDSVAAVPEPGIGVLLIGAVIGLAAVRRR